MTTLQHHDITPADHFTAAFITTVTDSFIHQLTAAVGHHLETNADDNTTDATDISPQTWFDTDDLQLLHDVAQHFITRHMATLTRNEDLDPAHVGRLIGKAITTGFDAELRNDLRVYFMAIEAQRILPTLNSNALLIWFPSHQDPTPARIQLTAMVSRQLEQYLQRY